jgi:predicted dehydrogenase
MITLGLIGAGTWGQNYLKLADKLNVKMLVGGRLDWHELINSKKCQGIIVATPPEKL